MTSPPVRQLRSTLALLVSFVVTLAAGAANRVGPEFQANTYVLGGQRNAALVQEDGGDFVVIWSSQNQDGDGVGIFGQRYDSAGNALATEFQVNSYTPGDQRYAAAASDADGDFVVAWSSHYQDGGGKGIFARRFASGGAPQAVEFRVNVHTVSDQYRPSVAMNDAGLFIVAWQSFNQDGHSYGVFARRFDQTGASVASEFAVTSHTSSYQHYPTVAADADGDFVVAWRSNGQDGDKGGIFARRFGSSGLAQATEFQVNAYTVEEQRAPAVAIESNGDFAVVWTSYGQNGTSYGVFGQRFGSAGAPLGVEFQVSSSTEGSQEYPALGMAVDGAFVVSWVRYYVNFNDIAARRFDSDGTPVGLEFQVNTHSLDQQTDPAVAARTLDFVIVWHSYSQDLDQGGVFGQRFSDLAALDVDGNGIVTALTDGMLVLRFLSGFSGDALTAGAVGGNCTRCDAIAIAAWVNGLGSMLDIDDDNELVAVNDGLLVLRFLFDFRGDALISGAVDILGCERCTANVIESYLSAMD